MQAKKSLGQNFLTCDYVSRAIVEATHLEKGDTVLEVGPGTGVLTEKLLERGATVVAVEKDDRLVPYLQSKFPQEISEKRLVIVHGDILEESVRQSLPLPEKYSVAANIPYYITGQFMRVMLESSHQPQSMVLMLQKEVVQRIMVTDDKQSMLSISIAVYGTAAKILNVPKHCFKPAPEIDSAVVAITNISRNYFKDIDEQAFFAFVKAGFAQKRKQLAGNLAGFLNIETEDVKEKLKTLGLDENIRAEVLGVEEWKKIFTVMTNQR